MKKIISIRELLTDNSNLFECDSVEEAIEMFKIAHDLGLEWSAGQSYTNESLIRKYWEEDGKEQVFRVASGLRNTNRQTLRDNDTVYKFSEVIKQDKMTNTKGFTKQEFLDRKVAIKWEDNKAEEINAFFKECNSSNATAKGKGKYYYTADLIRPGYFTHVETVSKLREEGISCHYQIDELIKEGVVPAVQTISRENLGKIYPRVCSKWQGRINEALDKDKFAVNIEVSEALIKEAFKEVDAEQKEMLTKYFKEPKHGFQGKMLEVGEIMKITGSGTYQGKHLFRTYDQLVCLELPDQTWSVDTNTIELSLIHI